MADPTTVDMGGKRMPFATLVGIIILLAIFFMMGYIVTKFAIKTFGG